MWFKGLIRQSFYNKRWGILSLYLLLAVILGIGWFVISDRIANWANDKIDERMPMIMNWLFEFLSSDVFTIIAWLILIVLVVIGFVILYKRSGQPIARKESTQPFGVEISYGKKKEIGVAAQIVAKMIHDQQDFTQQVVEAIEGHELNIQVEKGTYTRREPVNVLGKHFTIGDMLNPDPMLRIVVTAKITPTGTVPVQSLELHSNGQKLKCINLPSPVFDHEDIYTLGFETSLLSVKPALGKDGSLSFIRIVTPIRDVTSNSFNLESAE